MDINAEDHKDIVRFTKIITGRAVLLNTVEGVYRYHQHEKGDFITVTRADGSERHLSPDELARGVRLAYGLDMHTFADYASRVETNYKVGQEALATHWITGRGDHV